MKSVDQLLDAAMREKLQESGFAVQGGRDLFMEVMDTATGLVWMSAESVERADFESLELEWPLVKIGIARAPMDRTGTSRRPDRNSGRQGTCNRL
jgi:hypothetical protein